jgi:hypothetical protein
MTRKVSQRTTARILAISILFVAVLTASIASVAQSRQPGAVYASPETINARLSSTTRPQTSRTTSALPDQANPFFLPEVSYDSGGQGAGSASPTFIPTGPVTFTAGKTVLGTAELSGGKAKLTTSTLAVGSTTVTATYSGDSNVAGSSASVTQTVQ